MSKDQLGKCECSRCGTDPYLEPSLKAEIVKLKRRIEIAEEYIGGSDLTYYYDELEDEDL